LAPFFPLYTLYCFESPENGGWGMENECIPTLRYLGQRLGRVTGGEGVSDPLALLPIQGD
jgi:hypothetical protein